MSYHDEPRTIQEIEAEIHAVELRLSQLRSERNTLLPIHKVPREVFSHIFCLAAFSRNPKSEGDHRVKITSVSRYWRAVAIGSPILWTLIENVNQEWVELCLERSQDSPLEIDNCNADFNKPWPVALASCISRARSLKMKGFFPEGGTSLGSDQSGWARPALQLQILDVRSSTLPEWLFAKSAPLLRKLTLQSCHQDWKFLSSSFRGLTALKIAQPYAQIPLEDLLVRLAAMPHLVDLDLDRAIAPATATPQLPSQRTDKSAPFKTLNLIIKDRESSIPVYAHLLNSLENRINDKTSLDVKVYEGVIESQFFHVMNALTGRSWGTPRAITEISLWHNTDALSWKLRMDRLDISISPDDPPITSSSLKSEYRQGDSLNQWVRAFVKEMKNHMAHLRKLHINHVYGQWPENTLALFGNLPNLELEDLTIPCRNSFTLLDYPPTTETAAAVPVPDSSSSARTYPFPALKTLTLADCSWPLHNRLSDLHRLLEARKLAGIGLEKLVLIDSPKASVEGLKDVVGELVRKDRSGLIE